MATKEETYVELKTLDENIKEVQKHIEQVEEKITNLKDVKSSVEEFSKLDKGSEMRAPIANGIFVTGELTDIKYVHVNVGSNVVVKKPVKEVIEMLTKQEDELKSFRAQLMVKFQTMITRVEEIQEEFED